MTSSTSSGLNFGTDATSYGFDPFADILENQTVHNYHPPMSNIPRKQLDWVYNPADGSVLLDHKGRPISIDKLLATKPLRGELSTRPGPGNKKLTYISGEGVTRTLNDVFGFDGWNLDVSRVQREECLQDPVTGKYTVVYTSTVRLTHKASGTYKEDCGAGDATDRQFSTAVSHALKGSITDALKRAARHFGDKLGNSLYQGNFNVNKAPVTLKEALDRYDIERANTKFGFPKDQVQPVGQNPLETPSFTSNTVNPTTQQDSAKCPPTASAQPPVAHVSTSAYTNNSSPVYSSGANKNFNNSNNNNNYNGNTTTTNSNNNYISNNYNKNNISTTTNNNNNIKSNNNNISNNYNNNNISNTTTNNNIKSNNNNISNTTTNNNNISSSNSNNNNSNNNGRIIPSLPPRNTAMMTSATLQPSNVPQTHAISSAGSQQLVTTSAPALPSTTPQFRSQPASRQPEQTPRLLPVPPPTSRESLLKSSLFRSDWEENQNDEFIDTYEISAPPPPRPMSSYGHNKSNDMQATATLDPTIDNNIDTRRSSIGDGRLIVTPPVVTPTNNNLSGVSNKRPAGNVSSSIDPPQAKKMATNPYLASKTISRYK